MAEGLTLFVQYNQDHESMQNIRDGTGTVSVGRGLKPKDEKIDNHYVFADQHNKIIPKVLFTLNTRTVELQFCATSPKGLPKYYRQEGNNWNKIVTYPQSTFSIPIVSKKDMTIKVVLNPKHEVQRHEVVMRIVWPKVARPIQRSDTQTFPDEESSSNDEDAEADLLAKKQQEEAKADLIARKAAFAKQRADKIPKTSDAEVVVLSSSSDDEPEFVETKKPRMDSGSVGGAARDEFKPPPPPDDESVEQIELQKKIFDKHKDCVTPMKVWVVDDRFKEAYKCDKVDKNDKPYTGFLLMKFLEPKYEEWKLTNPEADVMYTAITEKHNALPSVIKQQKHMDDLKEKAKQRKADQARIAKATREKLAAKDRGKRQYETNKAKKQQAKEDDVSSPDDAADMGEAAAGKDRNRLAK